MYNGLFNGDSSVSSYAQAFSFFEAAWMDGKLL